MLRQAQHERNHFENKSSVRSFDGLRTGSERVEGLLWTFRISRYCVQAVQPPVVVMGQATLIFFQRAGERRLGVFLPVFHQIGSAATKVFLEPDVDARHLESALLDR